MFGFGKKKKQFNDIYFDGVRNNQILIRLENDNGESETKGLHINKILQYLPSTERVITKTQSSIWHVLGIMPTTDRANVIAAYRKMALVYHPDHGGTSESFQTLNNAKDKALAKCN